jgi:hypothetical protein
MDSLVHLYWEAKQAFGGLLSPSFTGLNVLTNWELNYDRVVDYLRPTPRKSIEGTQNLSLTMTIEYLMSCTVSNWLYDDIAPAVKWAKRKFGEGVTTEVSWFDSILNT